MAPPHNIYLAYKRETKYLLYWMINVSNRIIKSLATEKDEAPVGVNMTGQTTVSGLISMSKLIAEHGEQVPSAIYRLFGSIIQARSTVNSAFQQLVGSTSDQELKRNNVSHKHFIDTLSQAFSILGGGTWAESQSKDTQEPTEDEDVETIIFSNKFKALNIEVQDGDSSAEEADELLRQTSSAPRKVSGRPGKGKQGKKSKKGKKHKKPKKPTNIKDDIGEIPLESIKIIEDEDGNITDYLMAVYSAVKEWMDLRAYTQSIWKEVAYEGLNGAVAGAISNMAIAMIKRTSSAIFVDFPGHDSYETIMKTITRGNPDKAQGMFRMALYALDPTGRPKEKPKETAVNVKEQFLIYAYQDLVDFVTDFQANRTGKPTKAMQAKLARWDPQFNLQRATEEQRLEWRRSYIIRWLYDLVNVYSSIVVQRNTLKGERHVYERVDWSASGPWGVHRRLFGLNEFAGDITSMAMKKPGTDIRKMIFPHHVFQLQCIIDAFTVSRGWSTSALRGHVLQPPARDSRPRRDVDLFLDRNCERVGRGFLQGVHLVRQMTRENGMLQTIPPDRAGFFDILQMYQEDFRDWLGESKYMYGLNTIPPSRFSDHNSNGLWEYSPFLCGVGLMEGLELAYRLGMMLWEKLSEPMLIAHLHNMLVQKGYLDRPIGLEHSLQELFKECFFADGKAPTSNFGEALVAKIGRTGSRLFQAQRQAARNNARSADNEHGLLDLKMNQMFQQKSNLILYRMADWNPDGIPDSDVTFGTFLFFQRLGRAKKLVDPVTKETRLEDTIPVLRAKSAGMSETEILSLLERVTSIGKPGFTVPPSITDSLTPEGYQTMSPEALSRAYEKPEAMGEMSGSDLLELLKYDVSNDVAGTSPLSSLNYISVTFKFMMLFTSIENRLKEVRNGAYIEAYERLGPWGNQKRVALTMMALMGEDEECLKLMAEEFEKHRCGFMDYIYWDDLDTSPVRESPKADHGVPDQCVVM